MSALSQSAPLRGGVGRNTRVWIAAAVVLAGVAYLASASLQNNAVYYLTVSELQGGTPAVYGQPVRVAGRVVPGSIERDPQALVVRFEVSDESGRMPVTYRGVLPDIFGPTAEVVVEGKYSAGGAFDATTLLAKCPSRFEAV